MQEYFSRSDVNPFEWVGGGGAGFSDFVSRGPQVFKKVENPPV